MTVPIVNPTTVEIAAHIASASGENRQPIPWIEHGCLGPSPECRRRNPAPTPDWPDQIRGHRHARKPLSSETSHHEPFGAIQPVNPHHAGPVTALFQHHLQSP